MAEQTPAVVFTSVSKKFLTGEKYYPSLRDWVATFFSREFFRGKKSFFALKDLSFTILKGESVGFIGPNGAGKSTVLKLISKVSKPTTGSVETNGKIAGLLELGAGFHPELTGRENIVFQGTILGMSKTDISSQMKAIINFADLGEFIDSPVKHYSSGMHARLGFAVAIYLNPDILLIDEILSVGDAQFQDQCFAKINKFCQNITKAVVIVSHNLPILRRFCNKIYWLNKGQVVASGEPREIINLYLKYIHEGHIS